MNQRPNRYVIDPQYYRTSILLNVILIVFWVIWAPMTGYVFYLAYTQMNPMLMLWLIGGVAGTVFMPWLLLTQRRKQIIEITDEHISVSGTGIMPSYSTIFEREQLRELTLEKYRHENHDSETIYTLNLLYQRKKKSRRIILAYFMNTQDKAVIFEDLDRFFSENGLTYQARSSIAVARKKL